MERLSPEQLIRLFLALGVLLALARSLGELARRFNQPAVIGELLAGVLLGPSVLGRLAPGAKEFLFSQHGGSAFALDAIGNVSLVLFLLVAGLEVDLSNVWRQGRTAAAVSVCGIAVPFLLGFGAATLAPKALGCEPHADTAIFALFFATALSISALPVIAKTLMDLNLYRSDLGMLVIAAAVFDDITGWLIFAVILGLIGAAPSQSLSIGATIGLTLGFAAFMLSAGRWLVHRSLPWIQAHLSWPGGVLGFALSTALLGAAFTEWIGVHAIFGAFLVGVAIGDSSHLRGRTRATIEQFVSFFFAPLFFAGIGLKIDFVENFDPLLCSAVLAIACLGKFAGCRIGARWAGMERREGLALAFALNARGAMEIVLGLLAFQYGLISSRMFVALVVMAVVTSLMSGPGMRWMLARASPRLFQNFLPSKGFVPRLCSNQRRAAIEELCRALARTGAIDAHLAEQAVWEREQVAPTGIGNGIAVPHARIDGLASPLLAVGLAPGGLDFDAPDGEPAQLVFLILSPLQDDGAQLQILGDIARLFAKPETRAHALAATSHTEFLAFVQAERAGGH